MIMTLFAFPWAATNVGVLGAGAVYWSALAGFAVVSASLAVHSVRFEPANRRERTIPADWQRRYNFALIGELVLIAIAVAVLILVALAPLVPAVVAVIVGVHFLPLAGAFDQPHYRVTAAGMTIAGVIGAVLFLTSDPALCGLVAGLGSAVTLWWTSLRVTRAG